MDHHPGYPFAYAVVSSILSMGKTKLPKETKRLATQLGDELNGCAFCIDLGKRLAKDEKLTAKKLRYVVDFENQAMYTEAERAALRYALEATQIGAKVSDQTFNRGEASF